MSLRRLRIGGRAQEAASEWICPSCSLARSRRSFSSTTATSKSPQNVPYEGTKRSALTHDIQPRTIFSLIQPTGIPHLGNYLGALRRWKEFQDEKTTPSKKRRRHHHLFFGLADLHSLTLTQDRELRRLNIRQTYASLLALGLDPKESILFVQSQVSEHAELMWILSNVASTGYLSRMTQWKDKIGVKTDSSMENLDEKAREKLKLSLFSYPVLQAADILLYKADLVPVGEDQSQHVEFTRQLARAFNSAYARDMKAPVFTLPSAMLSPAKRIMNLQQPEKKMSKSEPDVSSRVLITDEPDEIRRKIKRAKTDSVNGPLTYDPEARPGVSNLIEILKHVTKSPRTCPEIAEDNKDTTLGAFKALVAEEIVKELDGIKDRYDALMVQGDKRIDFAMWYGKRNAGAKAGTTMKQVREAVGLPVPGNFNLKATLGFTPSNHPNAMWDELNGEKANTQEAV
ncbi:Tryptophan--tRNA ligase, mitochondrial [Exophiala xenobiotica]|uniref:tryptophan--tRNA ligase n=1 Tax=Lithohypha guttulata TaxID=1690604 RepID=A0ABR0K2D1_9EURO|nr:Tryptophan--tRNA ligase, mitochondrial [Lithohypha guttulata]KAK5312565.1 Tryptophan--tRNA ligase, mitochondrial [Exophiala xenobiotica]